MWSYTSYIPMVNCIKLQLDKQTKDYLCYQWYSNLISLIPRKKQEPKLQMEERPYYSSKMLINQTIVMKGEDTNLSMNFFHVQTPSRQWWNYSLVHEGSNTNFNVGRTVIYRDTAGHWCCSIRELKRQLSCNKEEKAAQEMPDLRLPWESEIRLNQRIIQFIIKIIRIHTFSIMATIRVLRGNWKSKR